MRSRSQSILHLLMLSFRCYGQAELDDYDLSEYLVMDVIQLFVLTLDKERHTAHEQNNHNS
jgi:hypothetical protein